MSSKNKDTRTRILEVTWHLMEQQRGQGVRLADVAAAAGVSRQAVYLHFGSRTELMIATTAYVDEVKGLNDRLQQLQNITSAHELLEKSITIWGNYIPEIYGLAKAMLSTRETDEAIAAAWDKQMDCLRNACQDIIDAFIREEILTPEWTRSKAIEMLWTALSIQNWEQLTIECGWSTSQYIEWMKTFLKHAFTKLEN
ncbi:MAG: TetR/AcrR family transcriptional regulator [Deferribacteres bacterium]|nr:TetR/AcrR family transcriptional regulator [Deferribacteres bacterium]